MRASVISAMAAANVAGSIAAASSMKAPTTPKSNRPSGSGSHPVRAFSMLTAWARHAWLFHSGHSDGDASCSASRPAIRPFTSAKEI